MLIRRFFVLLRHIFIKDIMNEYLFYTTEGYTFDPELGEIENCQLLGRVLAHNAEEAKRNLIKQELWLHDTAFDVNNAVAVQILTKSQMADIKTVVDFLWTSESYNYKKCGKPEKHIFKTLEKLRGIYEKWRNMSE